MSEKISKDWSDEYDSLPVETEQHYVYESKDDIDTTAAEIENLKTARLIRENTPNQSYSHRVRDVRFW